MKKPPLFNTTPFVEGAGLVFLFCIRVLAVVFVFLAVVFVFVPFKVGYFLSNRFFALFGIKNTPKGFLKRLLYYIFYTLTFIVFTLSVFVCLVVAFVCLVVAVNLLDIFLDSIQYL